MTCMTHKQLAYKVGNALLGTQRGLPRYICFNVNTTEIVIRYNSDVVKNEVEVSNYVGLAHNWELDCWAIATEIDKMCRDKFGIEILEETK